MKVSALGVFSCVYLGLSHASAWYLDSSCANIPSGRQYATLVTGSMQSAFGLSQSALDAINALGSNSANVQQQALQHYMFEESVGTPLISSKITSTYTQVLAFRKNGPGGNPTAMPPQGQNLPADDVIVFCDYSRFRNNFDGVKAAPGVAYDTRTGITTAMSSSFSGCRDQINFDTTAAWTLDNTKAGKVATIQICRWFLQFYTEGQKYRFLPDIGVKGFFAKNLSKLSAKLGKRVEMDAAALFDHTMLHEMTHAIGTNPTNDVGGPTKAYGRANCLALSPWGPNAITLGGSSGNADSYAYFGLGASMIANTANPEAPNEDGSIGVIAAGAGKRDLRPRKREVSALPGSTSLTSSEQTPTDTSVGPLVTPIYDTYDWDGNEDWEDDQQAVLSSLAADTTDPLLTWYGATASSTIPSITTDPFPCYHADPSNNGVGVCSCTGVSETFAVMSSTGSNTGTAYQPCDYTKIPSITPAPTPAANRAKYQYTETDFDHNVIACASSTVGDAGGIPYTACVGSSSTILAVPTPVAPSSDKPPPSSSKLAPKPTTPSSNTSPLSSTNLNTTVQVDLNKVLVGDVSQYSLNTTLIKEMAILCGPASASGSVCDRNSTTIPGIDYFDGDGLGTGGLTFTIQNSNYTSDNQAAAMIGLVANGLQNSATGANCHLHTYRQGCNLGDSHDNPDDVCKTHSITTCMAGDNVYVSVNDPDAYPSQIAFMNVQFIFDYESGDLFTCEEALDALVAIADFAVPEAVPEDPEILGAIQTLCMKITGEEPGGE